MCVKACLWLCRGGRLAVLTGETEGTDEGESLQTPISTPRITGGLAL